MTNRMIALLATLFLSSTTLAQQAIALTPLSAPNKPKPGTFHSDVANFTLLYPVELVPVNGKEFRDLMETGHHEHFGTDPQTDPEHLRAEKCMHTVLYAALPEVSAPTPELSVQPPPPLSSPPSAKVLVAEFDRSCKPIGLNDDKTLSAIAASVGQVQGFKPFNPQMWYDVAKHRIHLSSVSGQLSGTTDSGASVSEQLAIVTAAFEEKKHFMMVVFISNQPTLLHDLMQSAIQFGSEPTALLMPFAKDGVKLNLVP
jgi:hypothetical protein